jgi:methionyl-tRNA synthetase
MVLADVHKRWAKLRGDTRATLLTGTDEHGMKVQKAAEKAQTDVKLLCDQNAEQFKTLAHAANIDYDRFMRTTDNDHKEVVRYVWDELNRHGYIYESKHEGWYSVSDETFYPTNQIHKVLDPATGLTKIVSIETGKDVEWTSEVNYHFKLSAFQKPLLEYYRENPGAIVPQQRLNDVVEEIRSGLSDLSISRPSSRLTWGIQVPGDESQTIYVWLDALFNYLTMTGYPWADPSHSNSTWPPDCQVIGKDIIRFHTIYWPAFLMALGLPLPQKFLSHAHWTMNNQKMSKSIGNGVNPFAAMDRYGVDTIRFYMVYNGGIVDDAMYENSIIADLYNHLLRGGLGNLIQRVFRSKNFDVRGAVQWFNQECESMFFLSKGDGMPHLPEMQRILLAIYRLRQRLLEVRDQANDLMQEPDPRKALASICSLIGEVRGVSPFIGRNDILANCWGQTNRFIQNTAMWSLFKSSIPEERQVAECVLFMSAESVRIVAILLQPFMPDRMKAALDTMEVDEEKRTFQYATFGADLEYGPSNLIKHEREGDVVFPMLLSSF